MHTRVPVWAFLPGKCLSLSSRVWNIPCCSVMSDSLWPHGLQHARLTYTLASPQTCSCPLSQWCHPTISFSVVPLSSCLNLAQHSGLFRWVSSSHQVAKVLELQLQHQSFRWIFRNDFLYGWLVWLLCNPRDSQESFATPQLKSINSLVLSLLYSPTFTSTCDYWKNYSFDYMEFVGKVMFWFIICCLGLSWLFFQGASVF